MALRIGTVKTNIRDRSIVKPLGGQYDADLKPASVFVTGKTMAAKRLVGHVISHGMACGNQAASIHAGILMPEGTEEKELKLFMRELAGEAKAAGVMADAAAAVNPAVSDWIISGTITASRCLGNVLAADSTDCDVVIVGTIATEGTAILTREHREELLGRYTAPFLKKAEELYDDTIEVVNGVRKLFDYDECGDVSNHNGDCIDRRISNHIAAIADVGEGGIFAAFWNLADRCRTGLDVELKKIPIRQHAIEICEFFGYNPYKLLSGGCFLLFVREGEELVQILKEQGIAAAVVGRTTDNHDRIIRYDDEIRFLEPAGTDEIYSR